MWLQDGLIIWKSTSAANSSIRQDSFRSAMYASFGQNNTALYTLSNGSIRNRLGDHRSIASNKNQCFTIGDKP